jgi:hypothetical protein
MEPKPGSMPHKRHNLAGGGGGIIMFKGADHSFY